MSRLRYESYRTEKGAPKFAGIPHVRTGGETLIVTLKDDFSDIAVDLYYTVCADSDVLVRSAVIRNTGKDPILLKKAFTVSIGEASQVVACDYLGVESGNRVNDKIEKAGFHVSKAKHIDAPMIDELALCLECRLKSYDENTCQLIAQIVNVSIDERVLDEMGNLDVSLLEPLAFDPINKTYLKLGEMVGKAFKDGLSLK